MLSYANITLIPRVHNHRYVELLKGRREYYLKTHLFFRWKLHAKRTRSAHNHKTHNTRIAHKHTLHPAPSQTQTHKTHNTNTQRTHKHKHKHKPYRNNRHAKDEMALLRSGHTVFDLPPVTVTKA